MAGLPAAADSWLSFVPRITSWFSLFSPSLASGGFGVCQGVGLALKAVLPQRSSQFQLEGLLVKPTHNLPLAVPQDAASN